jgi:hypothetical protein
MVMQVEQLIRKVLDERHRACLMFTGGVSAKTAFGGTSKSRRERGETEDNQR